MKSCEEFGKSGSHAIGLEVSYSDWMVFGSDIDRPFPRTYRDDRSGALLALSRERGLVALPDRFITHTSLP